MGRLGGEGPFSAELHEYPLVRLTTPHVAIYDAVDVPSYFQCIDAALRRDGPFVILHDVRDIPHVGDAHRVEFLRLLEPRRAEVSARVLGYAAVVGSPLERGIMTAFMWFVKLPFPIRLFPTEAEARRWLQERYDESRAMQLADAVALA